MKSKRNLSLTDTAKIFVVMFLTHFFAQIIYDRAVLGVLDLRRGALLELLVMPVLLTIGFLVGGRILRLPIGSGSEKDG